MLEFEIYGSNDKVVLYSSAVFHSQEANHVRLHTM